MVVINFLASCPIGSVGKVIFKAKIKSNKVLNLKKMDWLDPWLKQAESPKTKNQLF